MEVLVSEEEDNMSVHEEGDEDEDMAIQVGVAAGNAAARARYKVGMFFIALD